MFILKLLRNLVLWISKSQPTQFLLLLLFVFCFFLYVGTYSVGKAQFCTVCPDGKFCPSTTTATETDCAPGTFSSGGQERCTPCPSGWKCPDRNGIGNAKCPPVSAWGPLKSHWLTLVHRLNFHFPAWSMFLINCGHGSFNGPGEGLSGKSNGTEWGNHLKLLWDILCLKPWQRWQCWLFV